MGPIIRYILLGVLISFALIVIPAIILARADKPKKEKAPRKPTPKPSQEAQKEANRMALWVLVIGIALMSPMIVMVVIANIPKSEPTETVPQPSTEETDLYVAPILSESDTPPAKTQKTLSDYYVLSADILCDSGEAIGKRAYLDMAWEIFSNATDAEKHDFLETAFDEGFEYLNIFFDNGYVLWAWGSPAIFQIGDMPVQGFGAVKYVTGDGIRGRYIWQDATRVYAYS